MERVTNHSRLKNIEIMNKNTSFINNHNLNITTTLRQLTLRHEKTLKPSQEHWHGYLLRLRRHNENTPASFSPFVSLRSNQRT
jgi:hypothetical protein